MGKRFLEKAPSDIVLAARGYENWFSAVLDASERRPGECITKTTVPNTQR